MRKKAISLKLQYCDRTPIQWLRTAAASLDESLAALCLKHWSDARVPLARPELERERLSR